MKKQIEKLPVEIHGDFEKIEWGNRDIDRATKWIARLSIKVNEIIDELNKR